MTLKTKFFRIATEGDTIDGRIIDKTMLTQMAEDYDPSRYGARIWPEHFHGLVPGGPFDPHGDVVALMTQTITDTPALNGKLGLYAQLAPLPNMVEVVQAKKKLYTSMEVMTNFARTGRAYLTGLAITNEPASQGTEMLVFSVAGTEVFCGADVETILEFEDKQPEEQTPSLFARIKELFAKKTTTDSEKFSDIDAAVMVIAESQQASIEKIELQAAELATLTTKNADLHSANKALSDQLNALKSAIEKIPAGNYTPRPGAVGDEGGDTGPGF